jgi:hypothetical protein
MSGLEKTNSWKPFIDRIEEAIQTRDFRKTSIQAILHFVDPMLSFWPGSIWKFFVSIVCGSGFENGRRAMFEEPFRKFVQKNYGLFVEAPLPAIQAFNKLVCTLFSKEVAGALLLDEQLARKRLSSRERLLKQGKTAEQSLLQFVVDHQRMDRGSLYKTLYRSGEDESLFSSDSPLSAETQSCIERCIREYKKKHGSKQPYKPAVQYLESQYQAFEQKTGGCISALLSKNPHGRDVFDQAVLDDVFRLDEKTLRSFFENLEHFQESVSRFFTVKEQEIEERIQKAQKREEDIREIATQVRQLQALFEPLKEKKDVRQQVTAILAQLSCIPFSEEHLSECSIQEIDNEILDKKEEMKRATRRIREEFYALLQKVRECNLEADFIWILVVLQRWEIVSGNVPYIDLKAGIPALRSAIFACLENARNEFISGKTTLSQFANKSFESLYTQDVRLLRGELTARSLRLKDIRRVVEQELIQLDRRIAILSLTKHPSTVLQEERAWLKNYHDRLIQPFLCFRESADLEALNAVFRFYWADIERFLLRKEARDSAFRHGIASLSLDDLRPIFRVLDRLEHLDDPVRKKVYQEFYQEVRTGDSEVLASVLEKWMEKNGQRLLELFLVPLSLCEGNDQERAINELFLLEGRLQKIHEMAAAIQSVKTYEPEKISSLLECCVLIKISTCPILSSQQLFEHCEYIKGILDVLEEEILIELGSLHKTFRIEEGHVAVRLQTSISRYLVHAKEFVLQVFQRNKKTSDPIFNELVIQSIDECKKLQLDVHKTDEDVFQEFQKLSVLIFRKRFIAAARIAPFARAVLILDLLQAIVKRVYGRLSQEVTQEDGLFEVLSSVWRSAWTFLCDEQLRSRWVGCVQDFLDNVRPIVERGGDEETAKLYWLVKNEMKGQMVLATPPCVEFIPGDLSHVLQKRSYDISI